MRPTILHAAYFDALHGGNFIASLNALEAACARRGINVTAAFPAAAGRTDWCAAMIREGRRVRFLPAGSSAAESAAALARLAREEHAAIIHTHFNRYDMAALAAGMLHRVNGEKAAIVWHAHSPFRPEGRIARALKNAIKFRLLGRSATTIAVSEHIRDERIAAGCSPARVRTIVNGVDLDRASAALRPREETLREFDIPPESALLLLFGWEPERKGVDIAVEAVQSSVLSSLPVVLGVVGTDALRAFVSDRYGAPPQVRILPPTDDVASLYRSASMFVSASWKEGFAYSVCEAVASGIPAVMSDIAGTSWAREVPSCVLFPAGDASKLAGAIRQVLCWSPEERARRCAEGADFVAKRFAVSAWAERVAELYLELLQTGASIPSSSRRRGSSGTAS